MGSKITLNRFVSGSARCLPGCRRSCSCLRYPNSPRLSRPLLPGGAIHGALPARRCTATLHASGSTEDLLSGSESDAAWWQQSLSVRLQMAACSRGIGCDGGAVQACCTLSQHQGFYSLAIAHPQPETLIWAVCVVCALVSLQSNHMQLKGRRRCGFLPQPCFIEGELQYGMILSDMCAGCSPLSSCSPAFSLAKSFR